MKVLLCDDELSVRESLSLYLKREGFEVFLAADGQEALDKFKALSFDFVILDLMMPKIQGTEVCKEIRKTSDVPVIMLTAKGEEIDRIIGFELGADDYIVKPYSAREVMARIKAILRRTQEQTDGSIKASIQVKDLIISLTNYSITHQGHRVQATPKEIEILYMLVSHPSQVFTREQILNRVWGFSDYIDDRSIDTHIKRIRSKLPESYRDMIKTVYGVGYKFEKDA